MPKVGFFHSKTWTIVQYFWKLYRIRGTLQRRAKYTDLLYHSKPDINNLHSHFVFSHFLTVDPCTTGLHQCSVNGNCVPNLGSIPQFICQCNPGGWHGPLCDQGMDALSEGARGVRVRQYKMDMGEELALAQPEPFGESEQTKKIWEKKTTKKRGGGLWVTNMQTFSKRESFSENLTTLCKWVFGWFPKKNPRSWGLWIRVIRFSKRQGVIGSEQCWNCGLTALHYNNIWNCIMYNTSLWNLPLYQQFQKKRRKKDLATIMGNDQCESR